MYTLPSKASALFSLRSCSIQTINPGIDAANFGRTSSATFKKATLLLATEIKSPAAILLATEIETTFLWATK